jgi:nonribosomal peptide synthetase protein BlmVI
VELQRRFAATSLFETLFVFTHFHAYRQLTAATGLRGAGWQATDQTYLPLTAHANVDAWSGQPRLLLEFDPAQFGREQIADIGGCYLRALDAIATTPQQPYPVARPGTPAERRGPAAVPTGPLSRLLDRLADVTDEEAAALLRGGRPAEPAPLGGGTDGPR